jgi:hypothetical protein
MADMTESTPPVPDHRAPRARFEFELEDHFPEREADAAFAPRSAGGVTQSYAATTVPK